MCIFQTIANYFKLLDVYQNGLKLKHNDFDKSQFYNKMSSLNILWIFHGFKNIYIYLYFADSGLPPPPFVDALLTPSLKDCMINIACIVQLSTTILYETREFFSTYTKKKCSYYIMIKFICRLSTGPCVSWISFPSATFVLWDRLKVCQRKKKIVTSLFFLWNACIKRVYTEGNVFVKPAVHM